MPRIRHLFEHHLLSSKARVLILGTFNPAIDGGSDIFYGRPRNHLPGCYQVDSLKKAVLRAKHDFMATQCIDFVDLIAEVDVPAGEEANVNDQFIDSRVTEWRQIEELLAARPQIRAVYFTRKTFSGIPNIKIRVQQIKHYCNANAIRFCCLPTPARNGGADKQQQWIAAITDQQTCLPVLD